ATGNTHAKQTAAIMIGFEEFLMQNPSDVVLVVGDVNSSMACAIVAKKLLTPVVHVEVGISSGDMTMPEEINRTITASIADHYFTTSEGADDNLRRTGVSDDRIHLVGNTMIDTLLQNLDRIQQPDFWQDYGLQPSQYFLATLHRPFNVDDPTTLGRILDAIANGAGGMPVIFPAHPRAKRTLEASGYSNEQIKLTDPVGYLEFIYLLKNTRGIITDSGGVAEEATALNTPCMFMRDNTERPETMNNGSSELVGTNPDNLQPYFDKLHRGEWKQATPPQLWDGKAAERIVSKLIEIYG